MVTPSATAAPIQRGILIRSIQSTAGSSAENIKSPNARGASRACMYFSRKITTPSAMITSAVRTAPPSNITDPARVGPGPVRV